MATVTVIHDAAETARWQGLASAVLAKEGAPDDSEMTLLFADEARMSELNERHMGKSAPTDVLAFPIDETWRDKSLAEKPQGTPSPDLAPPTLIGDVVICPEQCQDADGIAMRVVHGVLHLCGYDHADSRESSIMFKLQRRYLKQFDASSLSQTVRRSRRHDP